MLSRDDMQDLLDEMAAAYSAGDAAACAALFASDTQLNSPFGPPSVGREAIEKLHREWVKDSGTKGFSIVDYGSSDGLAWCLCRFSEDSVEEGTSLIVLEQDTETRGWSIRSCCLHADG